MSGLKIKILYQLCKTSIHTYAAPFSDADVFRRVCCLHNAAAAKGYTEVASCPIFFK